MSVTVFMPHIPIPAGRVLSISPNGEPEWDIPKRTRVRGSFESSLQVRSQGHLDNEGRAVELYIDGNPAKFLQGHNIFGSDDFESLLRAVLVRVVQVLGMANVECLGLATATVHRLDFTHSFIFDSRRDVQAYIRALALKSTSRMGRPTLKGSTCYFGQNSRRWSFKIYCKGDELAKHPLPDDIPFREELYLEADCLARAELTLRSLELKRLDRRTVRSWTPTQLNDSYREYVGRIDMNTQLSLPTDVIQSIRRCYRDTYFLWDKGICPSSFMSERTFFRHRAELKKYGVDIAVPKDMESRAEIIPLTRMIEGQLYVPPQWAHDEGLIFNSSKAA